MVVALCNTCRKPRSHLGDRDVARVVRVDGDVDDTVAAFFLPPGRLPGPLRAPERLARREADQRLQVLGPPPPPLPPPEEVVAAMTECASARTVSFAVLPTFVNGAVTTVLVLTEDLRLRPSGIPCF